MNHSNRTLLTVVGARPQFIKAAPVASALAEKGVIQEVLVHTGQHYDHGMSDVFFSELGIPTPKYQLGIGSGSHGAQTGRMLSAIEEVLLEEKPRAVLVYGDTNSTLAGALAAAKLHIPVVHVEAGLRSGNRAMPEEINRIVTDHVSDLLFAPTEGAKDTLLREGLDESSVHVSGDVMFDVCLKFREKAQRESQILSALGLKSEGYVLVTLHRAENTDDADRLWTILEGLGNVAKEMPVVLPLHPRTRAALKRFNLEEKFDQLEIRTLEPVSYLDMVRLESASCLIATDSGGVQKEGFFFQKPVVTLREETEWTELVDLGWNVLAPLGNAAQLTECILSRRQTTGTASRPYGDGTSAEKIAEELARFFD